MAFLAWLFHRYSGIFPTTSFPFQQIVARRHDYFNQTVPAACKLIEWVSLMTYQVKLIEEGSWCSLQTDRMSLSDDISSWTHWRKLMMQPTNWLNEFTWWLGKPNSLKKVRDATALLQDLFSVFTFILRPDGRLRTRVLVMRETGEIP